MSKGCLTVSTFLVALLHFTLVRWTRDLQCAVVPATMIDSTARQELLGRYPYFFNELAVSTRKATVLSACNQTVVAPPGRTSSLISNSTLPPLLSTRKLGNPQTSNSTTQTHDTIHYNTVLWKKDESVVDIRQYSFVRNVFWRAPVVSPSEERRAIVSVLQQPDNGTKQSSAAPLQSFMSSVMNLFHQLKEKNDRQRKNNHNTYDNYQHDEYEIVDILVAFLLFLCSIGMSACLVYGFSLGCSFCLNDVFNHVQVEDRPLVSNEELEQFTCPADIVEACFGKEIETNNGGDDNNERTCAVCLEPVIDSDVSAPRLVLQLPCEHLFHKDCVAPWLQREQVTCPLCKMDLAPFIASTNQEENEGDGDLQSILQVVGGDPCLPRPTTSWWRQLWRNFSTRQQNSPHDQIMPREGDETVELELAGLLPARR